MHLEHHPLVRFHHILWKNSIRSPLHHLLAEKFLLQSTIYQFKKTKLIFITKRIRKIMEQNECNWCSYSLDVKTNCIYFGSKLPLHMERNLEHCNPYIWKAAGAKYQECSDRPTFIQFFWKNISRKVKKILFIIKHSFTVLTEFRGEASMKPTCQVGTVYWLHKSMTSHLQHIHQFLEPDSAYGDNMVTDTCHSSVLLFSLKQWLQLGDN